jgi:hypothetical protein
MSKPAMRHFHLLLPAQAWWDAQRFDQPKWQVAAWHDQKVRHIHLHVAKALGKVVALLDAEALPALGPDLKARVRDEVIPDVAIYRSQLINLLPDGTTLPSFTGVDTLADEPLWDAVLRLSRASAKLAAYLEPREHGESSPASFLSDAIENLHASAVVIATAFGLDLPVAHRARLEALLGVSLPTSLIQEEETHQ